MLYYGGYLLQSALLHWRVKPASVLVHSMVVVDWLVCSFVNILEAEYLENGWG